MKRKRKKGDWEVVDTWDITAFVPLTKLEYYCEK
jgi:hypothetical protein